MKGSLVVHSADTAATHGGTMSIGSRPLELQTRLATEGTDR
jgi:hypothetical protein